METRSSSSPTNGQGGNTATATPVSVEELDIAAFLREVSEKDKQVVRSKGAEMALDNKGVSKKHWKRANKTEQSFLDGLTKVGKYTVSFLILFLSILFSSAHANVFFFTVQKSVDVNGEQKWSSLLVEVPNPNKTFSRVGSDRAEFVPLAFVAGSGEITQPKLELVNSMLCDWQVDLQLKRKPKAGGKKECPFYSPSTQNQLLRTFYSHMGKHHGWRFTENNFKGWKGCVDGLLAELYAQRLKLYVSQ